MSTRRSESEPSSCSGSKLCCCSGSKLCEEKERELRYVLEFGGSGTKKRKEGNDYIFLVLGPWLAFKSPSNLPYSNRNISKYLSLSSVIAHFLRITTDVVSAQEKAKFVEWDSPRRRCIRHPDSAAGEILNPIQVRFQIMVRYDHQPHIYHHAPQLQSQPQIIIQ